MGKLLFINYDNKDKRSFNDRGGYYRRAFWEGIPEESSYRKPIRVWVRSAGYELREGRFSHYDLGEMHVVVRESDVPDHMPQYECTERDAAAFVARLTERAKAELAERAKEERRRLFAEWEREEKWPEFE